MHFVASGKRADHLVDNVRFVLRCVHATQTHRKNQRPPDSSGCFGRSQFHLHLPFQHSGSKDSLGFSRECSGFAGRINAPPHRRRTRLNRARQSSARLTRIRRLDVAAHAEHLFASYIFRRFANRDRRLSGEVDRSIDAPRICARSVAVGSYN
jgi:hypothetical protein